MQEIEIAEMSMADYDSAYAPLSVTTSCAIRSRIPSNRMCDGTAIAAARGTFARSTPENNPGPAFSLHCVTELS